jgi:hypothetical protein
MSEDLSQRSARTAREALLAELFSDVDEVLRRQEAVIAAADAAAARLEAAARSVAQASADAAEAARASVGEYITRRANESAAQAVQTSRMAIDEAAAAALGKVVMLGQAQAPSRPQVAASPAPQALAGTAAESPGRNASAAWLAFGAGVVVTALGAVLAWWLWR